MVESLMIILLLISFFVGWCKNFENRSIFGKAMDKNLVSRFFDSRCSYVMLHAFSCLMSKRILADNFCHFMWINICTSQSSWWAAVVCRTTRRAGRCPWVQWEGYFNWINVVAKQGKRPSLDVLHRRDIQLQWEILETTVQCIQFVHVWFLQK